MHAILLDKVRSWAIRSCGYFPVLEIDGHGSTTAAHVAKYDGSNMFKWAKVGFFRRQQLAEDLKEKWSRD
jgi:hypothetical protein